jgi:hypothetical protein
MDQPLNIRPARMHMDGQDWVPAAWADALAEALREKQRSQQTHAHQFAAINDCFESLPARYAQAPFAANADAFRKHGLIATGHCDVDTIDCGDHAAACRAAPLVARLARAAHGYAVTVVRGPLVICSTPHSQSYKAMGKDAFNKSKADVLDWAERLLGVRQ